jgi:hypothetical protein
MKGRILALVVAAAAVAAGTQAQEAAGPAAVEGRKVVLAGEGAGKPKTPAIVGTSTATAEGQPGETAAYLVPDAGNDYVIATTFTLRGGLIVRAQTRQLGEPAYSDLHRDLHKRLCAATRLGPAW